ncbi:PD-(D/E)XK motif protein [Nitrospirillum sp. BR 11163]|uniref:PD-(D/E)XK motif protein n=1 Tax=Nitrospirillum sp. BR 11163 TaxID=3104323 RepID=UPI002B0013B1|nr:PD-(D/E)XK motif protein [Nitrospirillum sp. BR 11163]MEA1674553.1 PD-(D/E)XK motif protein [Nitrospirillum sp. BR 11163]
MAPLTDAESLRQAWRALSCKDGGEGWRTIPIQLDAPCRLLAGRHCPGDEEAIIVGFRGIRPPPEAHLPQGHGFSVAKPFTEILGSTHAWLALSRKAAGGLDLFAMMAGDVVRLLEGCATVGEERLFQLFLARIRAWQDFMERGHDGVLGKEVETGLFGEMVVLKSLLGAGMPATSVLDAWHGPLDGLHDFLIGPGAIEVKTTLSANGFPATVSSLEQLDETLRQPLFVAAVRLTLGSAGVSLPEFADDIRGILCAEPTALGTFESRLVQAGYLQAFADRYVRRFTHSGTSILPVEGAFPRLTRMTVNPGIGKARYEVDLDLSGAIDVGLVHALEMLGGK